MTGAPQSLIDLLKTVDTPTVCNAIEVVQGRRGFSGFTRGTMLASDPEGVMVGHAVTARIASRTPPTEPPDEIRARRMAYYRMVAEAPSPGIVIIEDVDFPSCVGAFWGEVNSVVHKGLGLRGALTNGVMRDLGDLAPGFPIVAGSVGPSHGFVRLTEIGTDVTVFGLTVCPGDLIHADRHGALVIPPEVIADLADAIARLRTAEALVLDPARREGFDFAALEHAWAAFEAART